MGKMIMRVDGKLAEGDIREAARALSPETGIATFNRETAQQLELKHPQPPTNQMPRENHTSESRDN